MALGEQAGGVLGAEAARAGGECALRHAGLRSPGRPAPVAPAAGVTAEGGAEGRPPCCALSRVGPCAGQGNRGACTPQTSEDCPFSCPGRLSPDLRAVTLCSARASLSSHGAPSPSVTPLCRNTSRGSVYPTDSGMEASLCDVVLGPWGPT